MENIVIKIRRGVAQRLKKLKVHPRESYSEVIEKLLDDKDGPVR